MRIFNTGSADQGSTPGADDFETLFFPSRCSLVHLPCISLALFELRRASCVIHTRPSHPPWLVLAPQCLFPPLNATLGLQ